LDPLYRWAPLERILSFGDKLRPYLIGRQEIFPRNLQIKLKDLAMFAKQRLFSLHDASAAEIIWALYLHNPKTAHLRITFVFAPELQKL